MDTNSRERAYIGEGGLHIIHLKLYMP